MHGARLKFLRVVLAVLGLPLALGAHPMGNFSVSHYSRLYFKEGAISLAWELLTTAENDGGLGFDPNDLWVTVYKDDDKATELWRKIAGLPEDRIQRLGRNGDFSVPVRSRATAAALRRESPLSPGGRSA